MTTTSIIANDPITSNTVEATGAVPPSPPENPPTNSDPSPKPQDGLPKIIIKMKHLPEAVAAAQAALIAWNNPPVLFDYGGELVKLVVANDHAPALVPMKTADLQAELTYAARWFEQTDKGIKAIYPPPLVVHALMQRLSCWAPPLREVVGVPIFSREWRLLDQPGYHVEDQIFYHPDHPPLADIPDHPSDDEVSQARRLLREELLGDFPFVTPADRASALAAMSCPLSARVLRSHAAAPVRVSLARFRQDAAG